MQLSHIDFLVEREQWEEAASLLSAPIDWKRRALGGSTAPVEVLLNRIGERLAGAGGLRDLFYLNLLSAWLRFPEYRPEEVGQFLSKRSAARSLLPEINLDRSPSSRWAAVPVLLALGERACLRYFIAGLAPGGDTLCRWPAWAGPLLDEAAKDALKTAAAAVARRTVLPEGFGFFCFPLCIANGTVQIQGRSLGLPLALAFAGLFSGDDLPTPLAATGNLDAGGCVRTVGLLERKIALLAWHEERFSGLIFPAENGLPAAMEGFEPLPVASIDDALMFSELYAPGNADLLVQLPAMLKDPERFIMGCRSLDPRWLRWSVARGRLAQVMPGIAASARLFGLLADRLEEILSSGELEAARALSACVCPEMFLTAAVAAPLAAFKWCTLNIALWNHSGNVAAAEEWIERAEALVPAIRRTDEQAVAEYYNNRLVFRHNHYVFSAELPGRLLGIIDSLEAQYRLKCDGSGCQTDSALGRLYGTVAQNFAFCGPDHLSAAERYFGLARKALGEGTVADLEPEWQRQLNYAAYAYLDAGHFDKAGRCLCEYLGVNRLDKVWSKLSSLDRWRHSLLARFLADNGQADQCEIYCTWAGAQGFRVPEREHPWQLWSHNCGRITLATGEKKAAERFFGLSLELCFEGASGPTVHVMALLPLSGLWRLRRFDEAVHSSAVDKARTAAWLLSPQHFRILEEAGFRSCLERVWALPQELFPFNYR